jgi:hypothetical protein
MLALGRRNIWAWVMCVCVCALDICLELTVYLDADVVTVSYD